MLDSTICKYKNIFTWQIWYEEFFIPFWFWYVGVYIGCLLGIWFSWEIVDAIIISFNFKCNLEIVMDIKTEFCNVTYSQFIILIVDSRRSIKVLYFKWSKVNFMLEFCCFNTCHKWLHFTYLCQPVHQSNSLRILLYK